MDVCMMLVTLGGGLLPPTPLKILPLFETGLPGLTSHKRMRQSRILRVRVLCPQGQHRRAPASQQVGVLNLHPRRHLPIAEYLTTKQLDK